MPYGSADFLIVGAKEQSFFMAVEKEQTLPTRSIFAETLSVSESKIGEGIVEVEAYDPIANQMECIIFEGWLIAQTPDQFKEYLATLPLAKNLSPEVVASKPRRYVDDYIYSNHIWTSRVGMKGETMFGQYLFNDWANAVRLAVAGAKGSTGEVIRQKITATPKLAIYTTLDTQAKFVYELLKHLGVKE